jgi:formylglycine-generating enzyme required for sulfatase activity|tara:strand:+ start:153 stop:479 length:327 start_codon:yes stop_codon:yes gene_type:complete
MRKRKRKQKNKKIIPLNLKSLGNEIEAYPFVAIEWSDIEGDAGWSSTKDLNKEKLPTCVSRGYLLSQAKGITRIFTDYIKTKDKPTFDNIGNTTIIPTSVIISIKKLN